MTSEVKWLGFIANELVGPEDYSAEISAGLILRRPAVDEITSIQRLLIKRTEGDVFSRPKHEYRRRKLSEKKMAIEKIENPNEWKYWVVEENGNNAGCKTTEYFKYSILSKPRLLLATLLMMSDGGHTGIPNHVIEYYKDRRLKMDSSELNIKDVNFEEIEYYRKQISSLGDQFEFVKNALSVLNQIVELPMFSRLAIVGYFSIIESLITHAPRLTESLDSITHQLRGKIALLSRQYDCNNIKPTAYQEHLDKTLWGKLYSFRSAIAHGNKVDFENDFQLLKNLQTVDQYLRETCIELIKLASKNPQLFADIKEC